MVAKKKKAKETKTRKPIIQDINEVGIFTENNSGFSLIIIDGIFVVKYGESLTLPNTVNHTGIYIELPFRTYLQSLDAGSDVWIQNDGELIAQVSPYTDCVNFVIQKIPNIQVKTLTKKPL